MNDLKHNSASLGMDRSDYTAPSLDLGPGMDLWHVGNASPLATDGSRFVTINAAVARCA